MSFNKSAINSKSKQTKTPQLEGFQESKPINTNQQVLQNAEHGKRLLYIQAQKYFNLIIVLIEKLFAFKDLLKQSFREESIKEGCENMIQLYFNYITYLKIINDIKNNTHYDNDDDSKYNFINQEENQHEEIKEPIGGYMFYKSEKRNAKDDLINLIQEAVNKIDDIMINNKKINNTEYDEEIKQIIQNVLDQCHSFKNKYFYQIFSKYMNKCGAMIYQVVENDNDSDDNESPNDNGKKCHENSKSCKYAEIVEDLKSYSELEPEQEPEEEQEPEQEPEQEENKTGGRNKKAHKEKERKLKKAQKEKEIKKAQKEKQIKIQQSNKKTK